MPDRPVRAALAGLEAAVLSWLLAVLCAVVVYVATAGAPGLGPATWESAAVFGTQLWTLGFGGVIAIGQGASAGIVSLAAPGLALLALVLLRGSIRRAGLAAGAALLAAGTFTGAVGVLGLVGGGPGRYLLGGALVGVLGTVWALRGTDAWPAPLRAKLEGLPLEMRRGLRVGTGLAVWLAAAGVFLVAVAAVAGWGRIATIVQAIGVDPVSAGPLILWQLAYLPTLAVWALSWLAGPGFSVGSGTIFSTAQVASEPLPAIPMLGALPQPGFAPGAYLAVLVVLCGVVFAWWRSRSMEAPASWVGLATRVGCASAALFGLSLTAGFVASGSIGPGRMAQVGVSPLVFALVITVEAVGGFASAVALVAFVSGRYAAGRAAGAAELGVETEIRVAPTAPIAATAPIAPTAPVAYTAGEAQLGSPARAVGREIPDEGPEAGGVGNLEIGNPGEAPKR